MLENLRAILIFLAIMTVLVAAHEYGHYLFARLFGMEVEEFAIGLGKPILFTWMRRNGTDFNVRAWPVGGFVRIKGMMPEDDGSEVKIPNGFYSKEPSKRFLVLLAGPVFSVLAGLVMLVSLYTTMGVPDVGTSNDVGMVVQGSVAEKAGIQPGDKIVAINKAQVTKWTDIRKNLIDKAGVPVTITVLRNGQPLKLTVTPVRSEKKEPIIDENNKETGKEAYQGKIGIGGVQRYKPMGFPKAVYTAATYPVFMVAGLADVFLHPKKFPDAVGGPVRVVAATREGASQGIYFVINLAGLLSMSVGILNLLPVPPLDGGQMVVAIAEMFRRGKRLSMRVQSLVNAAGLTLVMLLVVSVLFLDIRNVFTPHPEAGVPPQSQSK